MTRLLLTLVVLGTACGPKPNPQAEGGGGSAAAKPLEKTWTVAPGQFAEVNLVMPDGSEAVAEYQTDGGSLEWNVHSHPGKDAVVHDEGDGTSGVLDFHPPGAGEYSYLWENKKGNKPVKLTVKVTLSGGATVQSMEP